MNLVQSLRRRLSALDADWSYCWRSIFRYVYNEHGRAAVHGESLNDVSLSFTDSPPILGAPPRKNPRPKKLYLLCN